MPPHYKYYDEPFLRWLAHDRYAVEFLSDRDLRSTSGTRLRRTYDLMIFEGHHEYVIEHEYETS